MHNDDILTPPSFEKIHFSEKLFEFIRDGASFDYGNPLVNSLKIGDFFNQGKKGISLFFEDGSIFGNVFEPSIPKVVQY